MKMRLSSLLSLGGGLLFLGALGFIAIGDRMLSPMVNIPALGHEPGDAVAWMLVGIVLIPIGSVAFFIWNLYRRSQKPPPAYAEFLEVADSDAVGARGGARYR